MNKIKINLLLIFIWAIHCVASAQTDVTVSFVDSITSMPIRQKLTFLLGSAEQEDMDKSGTYRISVNRGAQYDIVVSSKFYKTYNGTIKINGDFKIRLSPDFAQNVDITGTVCTESGEGLSSVNTLITSTKIPSFRYTDITNSMGEFRLLIPLCYLEGEGKIPFKIVCTTEGYDLKEYRDTLLISTDTFKIAGKIRMHRVGDDSIIIAGRVHLNKKNKGGIEVLLYRSGMSMANDEAFTEKDGSFFIKGKIRSEVLEEGSYGLNFSGHKIIAKSIVLNQTTYTQLDHIILEKDIYHEKDEYPVFNLSPGYYFIFPSGRNISKASSYFLGASCSFPGTGVHFLNYVSAGVDLMYTSYTYPLSYETLPGINVDENEYGDKLTVNVRVTGYLFPVLKKGINPHLSLAASPTLSNLYGLAGLRIVNTNIVSVDFEGGFMFQNLKFKSRTFNPFGTIENSTSDKSILLWPIGLKATFRIPFD